MSDFKFKVKRIDKNPDGISGFLQTKYQCFLICPRCGHQYRPVHKLCGLPLDTFDMLGPKRECPACSEGEQEAILPENVADCPSCGLKCRTPDDVDDKFLTELLTQQQKRKKQKRLEPSRRISLQLECIACSFDKGLQVHHIDWNHDNNDPQNLAMICERCHKLIHQLGQDGFEELLERVGSNPAERNILRQQSIEWFNSLPVHRNLRKNP